MGEGNVLYRTHTPTHAHTHTWEARYSVMTVKEASAVSHARTHAHTEVLFSDDSEGNVLYRTHAHTHTPHGDPLFSDSEGRQLWAATWVSLEVCVPSDTSDKE